MWNTVKVALRKPVEPFEWTDAERELLLGAPLSRTHVIQFRLTSIVSAAILKSAIFMLVMIPDLVLLPAGFLGMFLGLLSIDALRLGTEVVVWGLTPKERRLFQCSILGFLGVFAANSIAWVTANVDVMRQLSTAGSIGFMLSLFQGMAEQSNTVWGWALLYPFAQLTRLVLATEFNLVVLQLALGGAVGVASGLWAVLRLDRWVTQRSASTEKLRFQHLQATNGFFDPRQNLKTTATESRRSVPNWGGVGPLAWRQCYGFLSHLKPMIVALGIPFLLCCLPAFSDVEGILLLANITAAVVFYSFLLLPTTCKFDFRRDVDRLSLLKSFPISPTRIVVGQIAGPILLTFVFQSMVMLFSFCLNPSYPFYWSLLALTIMLPLNAVIFGFENLLFLYYPHRLNQEGIHVFIRTILAFTAKGVVFATGLALVIVWFAISRQFAPWIVPGIPGSGELLFASGLIVGLFVIAFGLIGLLSRAFTKFDPSVDLAGLD